MKGHKDAVCCITFNWNDTHIASGSSSGEILIHNVVSGQSGTLLMTPAGQAIRDIQYSYFKKSYLAAVSDDGGLYLWDTNSTKLLASFSGAHKAPATALAFSPLNNLLLASCGLDKKIICYDVMGHTVIKTMVVDSPLTSLTFMHDGATLAAGSSRGKIFIFDLRKGAAPIKTLVGHKSSIQCLRFQHNASAAKVNGTMGSASKTKSTPSQNHHSGVKKSNQQALTPDPGVVPRTKGETPSASVKQDVIDVDIRQPLPREDGERPDSYGTAVISPLHDDKKKDSSNSYSSGRIDGVGNNSDSYNNSLTAGGIFSPLPNTSTTSDTRRTPIGSVSQSSSPYTAIQPIKSDVSNRTGPSRNANNSALPPFSAISPPQSASSSFPSSVGADSHQYSVDSIPDKAKFGTVETHSLERTDRVTKQSDIDHGRGTSPQLGLTDGSSMQASSDDPQRSATAVVVQQGSREVAVATGRTQGGPLPETFQAEFIRNMIEDCLEDFKADVHRDITNLQVEMLRQFQIQQNEIQQLLKKYSVNEELLTEVERLREENKRLKSTF
ncbi:hypothetical protein BSL78_29991 [Apostichopus japonicus]|uniref:Anaphase-promoting complex subunit 4-like WD40 domain-containing protein n=1 Tax=Stichopus japonicus TaxID=307972 RepID=A0A2G8JBS3_STIJA|nr:hypothetical protein BSL78_29991 [Apostichopus japonicus]